MAVAFPLPFWSATAFNVSVYNILQIRTGNGYPKLLSYIDPTSRAAKVKRQKKFLCLVVVSVA